MKVYALNLVFLFVLCEAQLDTKPSTALKPQLVHNELGEKIRNFTIELMYHMSKVQPKNNINFSPLSTWSMLAVIAEGATGTTRHQINNAIGLSDKNTIETRSEYENITIFTKYYLVRETDVEFTTFNAIFLDYDHVPIWKFQDVAWSHYDTQMAIFDFATNPENLADVVNKILITPITNSRITKLIDAKSLSESHMIPTSALYFKGNWTAAFNRRNTNKMPFYSTDGKATGEVNMMHNRHTYGLINSKTLQAKIIELPYGTENRLSMLVMLPHLGISVESMFLNFGNTTVDAVFEESRLSVVEKVDCFLPRFKIESDLDMAPILKAGFGIKDLFDEDNASLPNVSRTPAHVSKMIYVAHIEVNEGGSTDAATADAKIPSDDDVPRFEANRPFAYMVVEKRSNVVLIGGIYQTPSMY